MDEADASTPRWIQRFSSFTGAMVLLREGVDMLLEDPGLHPMTKEGLIQRFEFTFGLAWMTLKDYLEHQKVTLDWKGPADVLRAAFAANYITDGPIWMDALDARNELSHTYRERAFARVLADLPTRFLPIFEDFYLMLQTERARLAGA